MEAGREVGRRGIEGVDWVAGMAGIERLVERGEGMCRMEEGVQELKEVEGVGLIIALYMRMSLVFIPDGLTSVYGRVFPVV